MERVITGLGLAAVLLSSGAWAGSVLTPPPPPTRFEQAGESFPESRFGQPPAPVDFGVYRGYAARAVNELEASDEAVIADSSFSGRRPASAATNAPAQGASQHFSGAQPGAVDRDPLVPDLSPKKVDPTAMKSLVTRKGVQEVALIAGDLGYFPKTVFVTRDVPVRLFVTGASKNTLCIMMDSFQVRKQVRAQKIEEITFTPTQPGQFRFYCPVNGMEGTLIVKEFASAAMAAEGSATGSAAGE